MKLKTTKPIIIYNRSVEKTGFHPNKGLVLSSDYHVKLIWVCQNPRLFFLSGSISNGFYSFFKVFFSLLRLLSCSFSWTNHLKTTKEYNLVFFVIQFYVGQYHHLAILYHIQVVELPHCENMVNSNYNWETNEQKIKYWQISSS